MSVETKFSLDVPDESQATLTITMSLEHWKDLRNQMRDDKWPSCKLTRAIAEVVNRAETTFEVLGVNDG